MIVFVCLFVGFFVQRIDMNFIEVYRIITKLFFNKDIMCNK